MLGVRLDTVKNWSIGRRNPPEAVLHDLAALAAKIELESKQAKALTVAVDDEQAKTMGWPCVGAQHAYAGRVIARKLIRQ